MHALLPAMTPPSHNRLVTLTAIAIQTARRVPALPTARTRTSSAKHLPQDDLPRLHQMPMHPLALIARPLLPRRHRALVQPEGTIYDATNHAIWIASPLDPFCRDGTQRHMVHCVLHFCSCRSRYRHVAHRANGT